MGWLSFPPWVVPSSSFDTRAIEINSSLFRIFFVILECLYHPLISHPWMVLSLFFCHPGDFRAAFSLPLNASIRGPEVFKNLWIPDKKSRDWRKGKPSTENSTSSFPLWREKVRVNNKGATPPYKPPDVAVHRGYDPCSDHLSELPRRWRYKSHDDTWISF